MEGSQALDLTGRVLRSQLHSVHHIRLHSPLCSQLLLLPLLPLGTLASSLVPHTLPPPACVSSLLADLVFDVPWALSKTRGKICDGSEYMILTQSGPESWQILGACLQHPSADRCSTG